MRRRCRDLLPLKEIAAQPRAIAEARSESRVARNWHLLVGPAVARHTKLVRIHHQTLVMGCWKIEVMASLRQSAEAVWPQVRQRLEELLGVRLQRLEIVPCDPPEALPPRAPARDPLEAVLREYRSLRNQGWTYRRK